jgi:hypothetical protein
MTDDLEPLADPSLAEAAALGAMLARADVWEDPPAGLEADVVAAIASEAPSSADGPALHTRHRLRPTWWLGAAAAVMVATAGIVLVVSDDGTVEGTEIELTGSERAPAASGVATLSSTPAGLKILLDADGLDGAPDGYMFEVWVSDGEFPVSCGTFHQRGSSGTIELWAGVADSSYDRIAVTLEPLDGDGGSSGDVRLSGRFTLDD